ncbi:hypothetical protein [uncultured Methanobrevibacter sp.]|uniref:hypothetical protein n=1 Tax=uncultured Methanobrevibacter sp. TaxID=253161 RepID=UPI002620FEA1|nr:hypothetical protein [uncultured Methanobrevibacter sp.]
MNFDKNTVIIVLVIICFTVVICGGLFLFGNTPETSDNMTINNINNTTESVDNISYSSDSSSESVEDDYERPTRIYGGEEHLTAHESDVLDSGWDPSQHEVSRSDAGDGYHRINYDDGYYRICDDHGYVVTYGYG